MTKDKDIKTVVPALRFPEFRDTEGWEDKQLHKIGDTFGGLSGKSSADFGTGEMYVTYKQVFGSSTLDINKCELVAVSINEKQNTLLFGDILFTMSSETPEEIGYASVFSDRIKQPVYLNSFCFGFRPHYINDLEPNFSQYLFHSPLYRKKITTLAQGITRFNISKSKFEDINLFIPKPNEQKKIADCLGSLDDLISAVSDKIEALKEHKKGLMQQLFPAEGKTAPVLRFPEFQNAPEWQEVKLIDVTDKDIRWSFTGGPFGSNLKASDYTPEGIRVIQLQNIGDGEFIDNYKIYTSINKANELLSCNIYSGDIIMSKMGDPVGRACVIPTIEDRYVMCSDGIRVVVDEKKYNKYFIYSLINLDKYRQSIDKVATGSTRKRVGIDDLKQLKIILPKDKLEQDKIADCINLLDNQIAEQQQKLSQLKAHKKGLMQQLFPNIK